MEHRSPPAKNFLSSVLGEEDPGSGWEVLREGIRSVSARQPGQVEPSTRVHMVYKNGRQCLHLEIGATEGSACPSFTALLGMVLAHHNAIANVAWREFAASGQHQIEMLISEEIDGSWDLRVRN
jgi:hypothetical protein